MRDALIVFARRPEAGRVKTRLSPPLSAEQAAALYAAMLDDVLEVSAEAARIHDLEMWLAVTPADAVVEMSCRAPEGLRVLPQQGRDLPERMSRALEAAVTRGAPRILLRGSDSPVLDGEKFGEALRILDEAALVVCPDLDGGYNMVGLRRPALGLFDHPMSTGSVADDTVANARRLGWRCHELAPGFDLDTVEDLSRLRALPRELATACCPRTVGLLDEQGWWPG